MFLSLTAAAVLMLAEATPAAEPAAAPKPQMKKVCVVEERANSRVPKRTCWEEPVKAPPTQVAEAKAEG